MRINVYAEELPNSNDPKATKAVSVKTEGGRTFFGARLFLKSPDALHDTPDDDDRSAITIWGHRAHVIKLLYRMIADLEASRLSFDGGGAGGQGAT